jgi:hypothetical protein
MIVSKTQLELLNFAHASALEKTVDSLQVAEYVI